VKHTVWFSVMCVLLLCTTGKRMPCATVFWC